MRRDAIEIIVRRSKMGDWFLLYLLGENIDTVIFHNCKHLEDGGLEGLVHLKSTLKRLQVSGCYNLRDSCFDVVVLLSAIEQLRLFDLLYVKDIQDRKCVV